MISIETPKFERVLYHVHGIGEFDFSSMKPEQLLSIDAEAVKRSVGLVPTIFLRPEYLETFEEVCSAWSRLSDAGSVPAILGFAMEGPLLGASGGVPPAGCWLPDAATWRRIADLGPIGLKYVVIAPDALELDEEIEPGYLFRDLVDDFRAKDVRLALGHFRHDNPERSARLTADLIDYVSSAPGHEAFDLVTDHLFNDMPRRFTHAWRTGRERANRAMELDEFLTRTWSPETLVDLLGPVPATIVAAAAADKLVPMLNFDGQHVDHEICRRTVDYLGASRIIAITDHIEVSHMAGEILTRSTESTLLLRSDNVVAAGSTGIDEQVAMMAGIDLSSDQIDLMTRVNPLLGVGTKRQSHAS